MTVSWGENVKSLAPRKCPIINSTAVIITAILLLVILSLERCSLEKRPADDLRQEPGVFRGASQATTYLSPRSVPGVAARLPGVGAAAGRGGAAQTAQTVPGRARRGRKAAVLGGIRRRGGRLGGFPPVNESDCAAAAARPRLRPRPRVPAPPALAPRPRRIRRPASFGPRPREGEFGSLYAPRGLLGPPTRTPTPAPGRVPRGREGGW